jgi:uracil-DNA glycosylase
MSIEMTPAFDVPEAWQGVLNDVLSTPRSQALAAFLGQELAGGKHIYPAKQDWFRSLHLTAPTQVRVAILGQDPYHGAGQAHGLAFSVNETCAVPPSLRNIYKELARDLDIATPAHGNLEHWARQGVLLLNTVLTVEEAKPASHRGKGWEEITDRIIGVVAAQQSPTVFMLWGAHAQKKKPMIDAKKHLILEAPHPSPLSAHRGFLGCGHFGNANAFLKREGLGEIAWG